MKYWKDVLQKGLSFNEADKIIYTYRDCYMIRPEWDGIHFYDNQGKYSMLFKDGHVEHNMFDKAWDKDKSDWMIVTITDAEVKILKDKNLI